MIKNKIEEKILRANSIESNKKDKKTKVKKRELNHKKNNKTSIKKKNRVILTNLLNLI